MKYTIADADGIRNVDTERKEMGEDWKARAEAAEAALETATLDIRAQRYGREEAEAALSRFAHALAEAVHEVSEMREALRNIEMNGGTHWVLKRIARAALASQQKSGR